uniref:Uncharacterized protein n=1 Tax=Panagrolaimus sp. JU765 TaxID=591449 RepID=A0AC34RRW8_9BILA
MPPTDTLTILATWLPAINALSVMFIVTPYRRGIWKLLTAKVERTTSIIDGGNKISVINVNIASTGNQNPLNLVMVS